MWGTHAGMICGRNGVEIQDGVKVLGTGKESSRQLEISAREAWSKTLGGLWKYPNEGRRNKKNEQNERKGEAQTLGSCMGKSDENSHCG